MNKTFRQFCIAMGLALIASASAHADGVGDTFRDFTRCDAKFFQTMKRDADAWKRLAPLEIKGDIAHIKVKNRRTQGDNQAVFATPPSIAGLTLLSYHDEFSDLGRAGLYYYWGFIVAGNLEDVAQKLKPLIHENERLRYDNHAYVRTELKILGSNWFKIKTKSSTATGLVKTERVLLLEPEGKDKNLVRVSCSLQGRMTADLLKELRPDIAPSDYPQELSKTLFDDVKVPANVTRTLKDALAKNPGWKPKFKKLRYTYASKKSLRPKENTVTVELEAQDGLVRVKEIYAPDFNVQRLKLAGLVQVKARMNGLSDGRVYQTTELKLSLPETLQPGAKIRVHRMDRHYPPKPSETGKSSLLTCDVTGITKAETVFPTLTGRAIEMLCRIDDSKTDSHKEIFLEDLGIAVSSNSTSKSYGDSVVRFLRFDVDR